MHRTLRYTLTIFAVVICFALGNQTKSIAARPPKQVYAYYFGWHTGISWQDGRLLDQPQARYDSRERWAVDRHIGLAKSAGIDAFILSWFGRKDSNITAGALEVLLDASAADGFLAAVSIDMSQDNFNNSVQEVTESLQYILNEKINHPAYLRFEGKPVIYFWNQDRFNAGQWRDMRNALDPHHNTIWVMEGTNTSLLGIFDGLYLFNTAWSHNPAGTAGGWAGRVYGGGGKFFTPTVMPGWDESRLPGRTKPTPPQDRAGGAFLARSWGGAISAGTPSILIVSWNEFLENSYIEPSEKYGTTSLDVLRPLIAAWKGGRPMPQVQTVAQPPASAQNQASQPNQPGKQPAASAATNEWQGKSLTSKVGLLTVRATPVPGTKRLGAIDTGQVFPIKDKINGWFQIDFNGQKGYVSADMVDVK